MRRVLGTPAYARSRYEDLDGLLVVAGDGGPSDLCGGEVQDGLDEKRKWESWQLGSLLVRRPLVSIFSLYIS